MEEITVGDRVQDRITGYAGIVVAQTEWLDSPPTYGVQSRDLHDGKPLPVQWFEGARLKREV